MMLSSNSYEQVVVTLPAFEELVDLSLLSDEEEQEEIIENKLPKLSYEEISREITKIRDKILEDAKIHAQALLDEACAKKEEIYKEAYNLGFDEGKKQAEVALQAQMTEYEAEFKNIVSEVIKAKESMILEIKEGLVELVINLIRKMLFLELERNDSVMINLINNAVMNISNEENKKLYISQSDFDRFAHSDAAAYLEEIRAKGIKLMVSSDLSGGDCKIDYKNGTINVGLSTQLNRLEQLLRTEMV